MTSKRDLKRRLAILEENVALRDGFYIVRIGGDPKSDAGGDYQWDPDVGAYSNENGHRVTPEDAPDSFEFTIE